MRVLLVAFNYPPDPIIGAVRMGEFARFLERSGHEVRVIAAAGYLGAGPGLPPADRVPWFDVRAGRLVATPDDVNGLLAPGATSAPPSPGEGPLQNPNRHNDSRVRKYLGSLAGPPGGRRRKTLSGARSLLVEWPDPMTGWIPPAIRRGREILESWPCDVIIASSPPIAGLTVASWLAREFGVPWVADYRDLWTTNPYYRAPLRRKFDRVIERRLLRSANLATVVSEPMARDLEAHFDIRAEVVMNGYDPVELPPVEDRKPLSSARLNLAYVGGNLYGGRRTPAPLLRAARSLGWVREDIRFHFIGTDSHVIEEIAADEGATDLVEIHSQVPRAACLKFQARADALMLLMWNDPGEAAVYSGKVFEYISVARPIVMVGYPHGVAAALIRSRRLGFVAADAGDAESVLANLASMKPANGGLIPSVDHAKRDGLAREDQFDGLLPHLYRLAGSRGK